MSHTQGSTDAAGFAESQRAVERALAAAKTELKGHAAQAQLLQRELSDARSSAAEMQQRDGARSAQLARTADDEAALRAKVDAARGAVTKARQQHAAAQQEATALRQDAAVAYATHAAAAKMFEQERAAQMQSHEQALSATRTEHEAKIAEMTAALSAAASAQQQKTADANTAATVGFELAAALTKARQLMDELAASEAATAASQAEHAALETKYERETESTADHMGCVFCSLPSSVVFFFSPLTSRYR